jgi:ribulose-5-phosphate 4-epimerase/fuculose-1-phosphate aldolase
MTQKNQDRQTGPADGDIREELVSIVRELFEARVITSTGGNASVRRPNAEGEIWITPSRLFKGDLGPDVLVRCDLEGHSLDTGARPPSSECGMHCSVLAAKPEAAAVIHAHAPSATILANTGLPFLPISAEAAFFGDIPRVPFSMPGTPELASAVGEAIGDGWAVLLVNHGLVVAARSLRRAADMVELIERTSELILGCYAVGKEPSTLPAELVTSLRKLGDLLA